MGTAEYHVKTIVINNPGSSAMTWGTYLNKIGAAVNAILSEANTPSNSGKIIEFYQITGFSLLWGNRYSAGTTTSTLYGMNTTLSTTVRYDQMATFRASGSICTMTTFAGAASNYQDQTSNAAINAGGSKTVSIRYKIFSEITE